MQDLVETIKNRKCENLRDFSKIEDIVPKRALMVELIEKDKMNAIIRVNSEKNSRQRVNEKSNPPAMLGRIE